MPMRHTGFFDLIEDRLVQGWAISNERDDRNGIVDVFIDDQFVSRLCADQFRADVKERGYRGGFVGFSFEIPDRFCDENPHVIDIRHSGTDESLANSPRIFMRPSAAQAKLDEKRRWCDDNVVFENKIDDAFVESLESRRKLAILGTYHELPFYLKYHRVLLKSLTDAGFTVLIVHAASKYRHELASVEIPDCFVVLKRNIGYDFGSYAVGVFAAYDWMDLVDELLLINDSVLQISDNLAPMIARFRTLGADVVSCTDSFEREYHLQSYMLWFSSEICRSGFLPRFASNYSFSSNKELVIAEGEIGLSRTLLSEGFRIKALFDYETVSAAWIRGYDATTQLVRDLPGLPFDNSSSYKKALLERLDFVVSHLLAGNPMNPSHFFWDTLVEEFGCPFVKRELITLNPCDVPTYFKLAAHLMTQSEIEAAVLEIRRHYGGRLIPTSNSQRQPVPHKNKLLLAKDYTLEPLEPTLRSFRLPEFNVVARMDKSA